MNAMMKTREMRQRFVATSLGLFDNNEMSNNVKSRNKYTIQPPSIVMVFKMLRMSIRLSIQPENLLSALFFRITNFYSL